MYQTYSYCLSVNYEGKTAKTSQEITGFLLTLQTTWSPCGASGKVLASWLLLSTDAGREPTAAMKDHRHPEPAKPQKSPDQNARGAAPWPRAYDAAQDSWAC